MPYLSYVMETSMAGPEFLEMLQRSVGKAKWFAMPAKDSAPFFGKVSKNGFKIMRKIRGRDSFNPVLYGKFSPLDNGTRVRVVMTFHPIIWVFILGWTFFHGYWMFQGFRELRNLNAFGSVQFLLFLWLLAVPIFFIDAVKSKYLLVELFRLHDVRSC
jgi:hypothetical protein